MKGSLSKRLTHTVGLRPARSVVWLVLLSFAICLVGFPGYSKRISPTDEPFPCMHCPCGCHSAAQCWDQCCCHTDVEKLAWAKRNGVTPPTFLLERVQQKTAQASPVHACCAKRACCASATSAPTESSSKPSESVRNATPMKGVLWVAAQRCKGGGMVWQFVGHQWAPRASELLSPADRWVEFTYGLNDVFADSMTYLPDPPVAWALVRSV